MSNSPYIAHAGSVAGLRGSETSGATEMPTKDVVNARRKTVERRIHTNMSSIISKTCDEWARGQQRIRGSRECGCGECH
eukprot:3097924-Prymnesium_polylepis.1